jgi:hypothetical protein
MQGRLSVQEVKECAAACLASPKTSITTRSVIQEGFDLHAKMQRKKKKSPQILLHSNRSVVDLLFRIWYGYFCRYISIRKHLVIENENSPLASRCMP